MKRNFFLWGVLSPLFVGIFISFSLMVENAANEIVNHPERLLVLAAVFGIGCLLGVVIVQALHAFE